MNEGIEGLTSDLYPFVLYKSDHHKGENGIWCKYCVFENQVRATGEFSFESTGKLSVHP